MAGESSRKSAARSRAALRVWGGVALGANAVHGLLHLFLGPSHIHLSGWLLLLACYAACVYGITSSAAAASGGSATLPGKTAKSAEGKGTDDSTSVDGSYWKDAMYILVAVQVLGGLFPTAWNLIYLIPLYAAYVGYTKVMSIKNSLTGLMGGAAPAGSAAGAAAPAAAAGAGDKSKKELKAARKEERQRVMAQKMGVRVQQPPTKGM